MTVSERNSISVQSGPSSILKGDGHRAWNVSAPEGTASLLFSSGGRGASYVEIIAVQRPQTNSPSHDTPLLSTQVSEEKALATVTNSKFIWGGVILGASILGIFLFGPAVKEIVSQPKESRASNTVSSFSILPVEVTTIEAVDSYPVERTYTGTIVPRNSSVLSFELAGKLANVTVDEGDFVAIGTSIAFLDTRSLENRQRELLAQRKQMVARLKEMQAGARAETVAAAEASVRQLTEQLRLARQKSDRRQDLFNQGAISQEQRDEAVNETTILQARLDNTQSQLDEILAGTRPEQIEAQQALIEQQDAKIASLDIEKEKSILRAPFSGTIADRLADIGTVLDAGQAILKIVENNQLEAHIGIPAHAASAAQINDIFTLKVEQKSYQARVTSVLPELDPQTLTVTVVLDLNPADAATVLPGQVAELQLTDTINSPGYWLPTTALVEAAQGLWSCYVLSPQHTVTNENQPIFQVEENIVEILHTQGDRVLVRGTLQPNQQVITDGIHRIVPGQNVRISNGTLTAE
ncbi:MAG: efflux RND transporter periplasmic adaptor subunit [Cyanobacteria bacterium P01_F01_bin.150]